MKKQLLTVLVLILALSTFLVACSKTEDKAPEQGNQGGQPTNPAGTPKDGGVITYAVDAEPEGFLEAGYYFSAIDSQIIGFIQEGMFKTGDDLKTEPNLATWEESDDHKTYTFHIKEGVKWHNGDELTADDWAYSLDVLANKDYTGKRYENVREIVGAEEVHAGTADHISGVKVLDPYTMEVTFKEAKINNLDNLWSYPMPKKYYEGIAVKDLANSEKVRAKAIGVGPFKVKNVVPGESVELVRNDDYWQGKPHLDGIVVKVIDSSLITGMLESGQVDVMEIRPANIDELAGKDNVVIKEQNGYGYSYIAFDFGHYDNEKGTAVADNLKFQDKKLRQAIAYALDRQSLINAYLKGKATVTNSPVPSVFWTRAPESELNQYEYNPEKAKQLLAEAGYKDVNGDGFVEDPNGKPFTINFGHYAGSSAFEGRSQAMIQNLRDVGLDVKLMTGSLVEFNLYNQMKDNDDPQLELFFGSWSTGSDPDPSGMWASYAKANYGRWVDTESDQLMQDALSEKAFDDNYRKDTYVQWQKRFNDELPAIPLWENMDLYGMNKRLQGVHVNATGIQTDVHKWWVE